jgi:hypothetical protein
MRLQFLFLPLFFISFGLSNTGCFAQRTDTPSARFVFEKSHWPKDCSTGSWRSSATNLGSVRSGSVCSAPLLPSDLELSTPVYAAAAPAALSAMPSYVSQFGVPRQGGMQRMPQQDRVVQPAGPLLISKKTPMRKNEPRHSRESVASRRAIAQLSGKRINNAARVLPVEAQQYPSGIGYSPLVDAVEEKVHGRVLK